MDMPILTECASAPAPGGARTDKARVAVAGATGFAGQELLRSREVADRYLGIGVKPETDAAGNQGARLAERLRAALRA